MILIFRTILYNMHFPRHIVLLPAVVITNVMREIQIPGILGIPVEFLEFQGNSAVSADRYSDCTQGMIFTIFTAVGLFRARFNESDVLTAVEVTVSNTCVVIIVQNFVYTAVAVHIFTMIQH